MQLRQSAVRNVTCGENVVIYEPANLYDCTLGDNVFVGPFVEIGATHRLAQTAKFSRTPSSANMSPSAPAVLSVMA